jgi:hypothetical protein
MSLKPIDVTAGERAWCGPDYSADGDVVVGPVCARLTTVTETMIAGNYRGSQESVRG